MSSPDLSRFNQLVKQNELAPNVANQLYEVLSGCEIVLLCDDSDSMSKPIAEEGTDPFADKRSTRWLELKKLASIIINFVTSINPNGLDIYFLNRPKISNVTSAAGLQNIFNLPPTGGTPLIWALNSIYQEKANIPPNKNLLIVVITDGEPTDGTRNDLYNILISKRPNVHISFAECTDNAEDMEYLDAWDGVIKNFDNTEDYREELNRVKSIQGPQFKFDFTDYVIKILLATFVRWYFSLDQVKVNPNVWVQQPMQQFRPPVSAQPYPIVGYQNNPVLVRPPVSQVVVQTTSLPQRPPSPEYSPPPKKGCCTII
jgi:hypothetical protein